MHNQNRDLVVIGGYPIDKNRISILKETILSLNKHFDILLCTHYPADIELQKLVNYYIYDDRNEFFENETVHMWYSNDNIYFEYYYGENKWKHHSYAIYRNLLNSVGFLSDHYEDFYYVDGDSIFAESDIEKLKEIKSTVSKENKEAFFFYTESHIQTIFFYFKTKFFTSIFPNCKNINDYKLTCENIDSFGVLENFFYRVLKTTDSISKVVLVDEMKIDNNYFSNSKININRFNEDDKNNIPFDIKIFKVKNSNDFAYLCISKAYPENEKLDLFIDGEFIAKLPGEDFYTSKKIIVKNNTFTVKVGDQYIKTYTKEEILKSKSFIEFK